MASRRGLKKDLNYIYSDLMLDAFSAYQASEKSDDKAASALLKKISDSFSEFKKRASHTDGKGNKKIVKAYYKKLWDDVLKDILALSEATEKL